MKKTLFAKLIAVLLIVCATIFVATACDFGFGEGESSSSVSSFYEQSESSFLEDSSSAEDSSGGEDEGENGLEFTTVQIENNVGSISVSNATEKFSFADEITVVGNAKYVVSLDEYGINTSLTKVVPLTVGDNLFYIFEMVNDEIQNTYLITVRRRPKYTVSFNTDGGTAIQSQSVEEGFFATQPQIPTRNGYDFISWAYDFATPITKSITINAAWSAITYSLTYDLAGGVIEEANPNEYTIESRFTLTTPTRENYEFLGWYDANTKITTLNGNYGNKTLTAKWDSIYNYSNGTITGLKSNYKNRTSLNLPSEINGEKITTIGDSAFYNCSNLTSVVIGDSVTSIGSHAFYGCSSLTSVVIGDSVTSIGADAFEGCNSLTSIEIPNSVTSIGDFAFYYCSGLTSVVIGDSVTSIGVWAFLGCSSLTSIKYRGTEEEWNAIPKGSGWDFNAGNYTITYNYIGE